MFDHLEFSVAQIDASKQFYSLLFAALGVEEIFFDEAGKEAGFGAGGIVRFLLFESAPTVPKLHICFSAQSKESVAAAYAAAISGGGTCNGAPGYREHYSPGYFHYSPGYFAAFMLDPDGHNVEVIFREP